MTHAAPPPPVLAIISDLLFRSKIDDAARQSGVPLRVAKSAEQLDRHLAKGVPVVVLVDLEMSESAALLARLRATSGAATVPVIGFAGHTNVDVIRAARADGVQVMARSAFVDQLPTLMSRLATAHGD
jgi:DNA-binding NtrC family response regulator